MADFNIPTGELSLTCQLLLLLFLTNLLDTYDVNVSPDKRTILLHNEGNLILALKVS